MDAPQESVQMSKQESSGTVQTDAPKTPRICMLDIETLDTAPTAKIVSLGAVDVYGKETWYQEFSPYNQYGRTVSQATLDWWEGQGTKPNGDKDLIAGLEEFHAWYTEQNFTEVWCKGTDFDFVILKSAYEGISQETPWKYNHVRDLRTLIKLFPQVPNPAPYSNHHALVDAICQAQHLKEILSYVNEFTPRQIVFTEGLSRTASSNQLR